MYDHFDKFEAIVHSNNNLESQRVLEKNGFKFNGRWRKIDEELYKIFEHEVGKSKDE